MKLLSSGKPQPERKQRIIRGDVLDFAKQYRGPQVHALLCDPPYHLTSITKRFGGANAAAAKFGKDGAFARASRGFMNADWDGGDIAFRSETWAAFGDIMLDGAFGMAFASTRGYHQMACAIEDAGFVIHPMFAWVFLSGFPKATRVPDPRFEGHRYGGQMIKPSFEPICLFQKPYRGRPVDCIIGTGGGTLNIAAGRIGTQERINQGVGQWNVKLDNPGGTGIGLFDGHSRDQEFVVNGRWPGSIALVHNADCLPDHCSSGCPIALLDEQSGERSAGGNIVDAQSEPATNIYSGRFNRQRDYEGYGDTGGASRIFHNADWALEIQEQIEAADPFFYEPKASAKERNLGLECRESRTVGDGRQKSIDNAYQRGKTERRNTHPAVKPIGLTTWLAKLLLPPAEYGPRRLFTPFCGSGSEMIGAALAGWETIYGVELSQEYASIARARLNYYTDPLRQMRSADVENIKPTYQQLTFMEA